MNGTLGMGGEQTMDEFIKDLDQNLEYLKHVINNTNINIYVISNRKICKCPYCGFPSQRIHSYYEKSFQDLPIMGKKTKIFIKNKKMFCDNRDCSYTTFAERFDFLEHNSRKSKRLVDKIIEMSLYMNAVELSKVLKNGIAEIEKSTICNLLKNTRHYT